MARTDVSEEFPGELGPEVVEEIFDTGGGTTVVIGGTEEEGMGVVDGTDELFVAFGIATVLGIEHGEIEFAKIDVSDVGAERLGVRFDEAAHRGGGGFRVERALDDEEIYR